MAEARSWNLVQLHDAKGDHEAEVYLGEAAWSIWKASVAEPTSKSRLWYRQLSSECGLDTEQLWGAKRAYHMHLMRPWDEIIGLIHEPDDPECILRPPRRASSSCFSWERTKVTRAWVDGHWGFRGQLPQMWRTRHHGTLYFETGDRPHLPQRSSSPPDSGKDPLQARRIPHENSSRRLDRHSPAPK